MKLKHTPGPWRSNKPKESNGFWHIDDQLSDYGMIATCYGPSENVGHDARLIAAAPDMLDALIWIYSRTQTGYISNCDDGKLKLIIESATGLSIDEVLS